jgi:hypothetical protein
MRGYITTAVELLQFGVRLEQEPQKALEAESGVREAFQLVAALLASLGDGAADAEEDTTRIQRDIGISAGWRCHSW